MGDDVRDLIIIGSGPAGYTSAIYAARASLHPVVLEGSVTAGGALMTTTEVENYPGFPEGIQGPELMEKFRAQAERFGAELITDDAVNVDLVGPVKSVLDGSENTWHARAVILATGSGYRKIGIADEDRLSGHGVSWCATCDGFFFRNQDVAVVGGGDSAMEEAIFLARFASSVTVIHRRAELRASRIMADRAMANPKIKFIWNSTVASINGTSKVESVGLQDTRTGAASTLAVTGLFVAIGHDPRSELFVGQVDLDPGRYVQVLERTTSVLHNGQVVPGVFAAGDLVDHSYRQAITAAGSGCAAALDAERYLSRLS